MTTSPPNDQAQDGAAGARDRQKPTTDTTPLLTPPAPIPVQPEKDVPFHLGWLVFWGILGTVVLGGLLFSLFTWTQTDFGWRRFFTATADVDGDVLFNSARTALTMVTVIGLGGAALLAYRRQRSTELAHNTTSQALHVSIWSQQTAAKAQQTAANAQQTAAEALLLNQQQFEHTTERALRERYTEVAELLGSTQFAMRMAGVFALAALADDWHSHGDDTERQVCVDLLCAYLRTDTLARYTDNDSSAEDTKHAPVSEERAVRAAVAATIRQHRRSSLKESDRRNWASCKLDLSGANLSGADLSECDLRFVDLSKSDLSRASLSDANLGRAYLVDARLSKALMMRTNLTEAALRGASLSYALLDEAKLVGADLTAAKLLGTELSKADLTGAHLKIADLTTAKLTNANLTRADLTRAELVNADLTGATLDGAIFEGAEYSAKTQWPSDSAPHGTIFDDSIPDD